MDEELETPNSWISVKALRNAADIRSSLVSSHKSLSSTSDNTIEKNLCNDESNFYYSTPKKAQIINSDLSSMNYIQTSPVENKYTGIIFRLNEEIAILSFQLKQANDLVSSLSNKLKDSNLQHALHIQALQERHEQKLKKHRQQLEELMRELNNKNNSFITEILINSHQSELNKQRENFHSQIFNLNKLCQQEIEKNVFDHARQVEFLKNEFFSIITRLKQNFVNELEFLDKKYNEKLQKIKNKENSEEYSENFISNSIVFEENNESDTSFDISNKQQFMSLLDQALNTFKEELDHNLVFQYKSGLSNQESLQL